MASKYKYSGTEVAWLWEEDRYVTYIYTYSYLHNLFTTYIYFLLFAHYHTWVLDQQVSETNSLFCFATFKTFHFAIFQLDIILQYNFHNALKIFYNVSNIFFNFTILFAHSLKMRIQYWHENNVEVSILFQFLTYKNKNRTYATDERRNY